MVIRYSYTVFGRPLSSGFMGVSKTNLCETHGFMTFSADLSWRSIAPYHCLVLSASTGLLPGSDSFITTHHHNRLVQAEGRGIREAAPVPQLCSSEVTLNEHRVSAQ